jgi:site-specific recombinase XerD
MPSQKLPIPIFDTMTELENSCQNVQSPSFGPYDLKAAIEFLQQYNANKCTFESYRREIERLFQWAWYVKEKSILELRRQDMQDYIEFCLNPPLSWIGTERVLRFILEDGVRKANPKWRPFVATVSKHAFKTGQRPDKNAYQLSQKALREIFTILSSFYNYLVLEEKALGNPIALIRQKSKYLQKNQHEVPVMRLTDAQWQICLETVKEMADENPVKHERTLFIISALYLLYLRISELVENQHWIPMMKHFYQDANHSWWFKIVGKGNKMRNIAVSDDMLAALKRYRQSMGLPLLPSSTDKTPLLPKEKGKGAMANARHIRRIMQLCFDKTIEKLRKKNATSDADAMEAATVHWLRHTGISDDINKRGRPVAHVRDDAGHSSSAITDRYNNIELKARYKSAKNKKLKNATQDVLSKT